VQAYVTEIRSKVPFSPDLKPEDLILQAEHAEFLEQTSLDRLRPDADLSVSCPGQYETMLEHIEVHRHYMGIEQQREIPYQEAAEHWFDTVYLPVVQIVRELGIMREFPDRTEGDLYLWISRHRAALQEALGWEITTSSAAVDLADQHSSKPTRVAARIGRRVVDIVLPDSLEPGPPSGMWRRERMAERPDDRLFVDLLVTIPGDEMAWRAMEQALILAQHEGSRVLGLHVVETEEDLQSETLSALSDRFYWRCGEVGIVGKFVAEAGTVSRTVCDRARWADLVVASLAYPPQENPVSRLSSGFRKLIKCSSRPILTVPGATSGLMRPLLAYDGQPRAREALFVAAYLAGRWSLPLIVVTVDDDVDLAAQTIDEARDYLVSHGVDATYLTTAGAVSEAILTAAGENGCDWLIVGGYGGNPLLEVVKGGVLNEMLNAAQMPMLIAQ
jgi:nucleotide-binding universal stress UspA family protein